MLAAGATVVTSAANSASGPTEKVSTSGTDSGNCVAHPCATINYAISQAVAGETISVAAGIYNQTVNVNKAVTIKGAGATKTTLDGNGIDPSGDNYYGVVYFGNTGGDATISGFTITNPYPDAYTGGEPMAVVLHDGNAGDLINVLNNTITEGSADSQAAEEFPIGIDSFVNAASTTISGNSISGFFQGSLLEDNGPVAVSSNKFINLAAGSDGTTTYPAEGLFFLADEGGTYNNQNASNNTFSGYSGYGIAEEAGYGGGYVTPGCIANGSIGTALSGNSFALTGSSAATGIDLHTTGGGNDITGSVNSNHGYVTAPSNAIEVQSDAASTDNPPSASDCSPYSVASPGGGTLDVTENNDDISVKSGVSTALRTTAAKTGGLHVPKLTLRRVRHHA
jgi:hypothetical protein